MITCAITRKTPEIYLDYWAKMLVAKTLEYHSFKTDLGTTMHITAKTRLLPRMAGQVAASKTKRKVCCRGCGVDGHNSIDCDSGKEKVKIYRQSLKGNIGVSQLIHAVDWDGTNADAGADEGSNFVFLQKSTHIKTTAKLVSFKSDGADKCTKFGKDSTISKTHKSTIFSQANSGIPSTWYLLDNQSTCNIVSNPKLVKNIRQVEGCMQLATQAGSTATNWMADVPGYYHPVWLFHPGGITSILSMVNMIARYQVTYDSHEGKYLNQFCVHKGDGTIRRFLQSKRGLYYLDTATTDNRTVLVTTVEENKFKYTNHDYSHAKLARHIQTLVGRPELKDFLHHLDNNALPHSSIQGQDAINVHAIFGRDVNSLKGKITKQQLKVIIGAVANNLPQTIMEHYREINLCIDIMFVNQIPFFMSISKHIRFLTCELLENRKAPSLIQALKRI
jgi:hypothetical protein